MIEEDVDTEIIIKALRQLAKDMQSLDGVPEALCEQAANRLELLSMGFDSYTNE